MDKKFLFVTGVARSGTTALTVLLNTHPDIALGLERYKFLYTRDKEENLSPGLFEPDRFFSQSEDETNVPLTKYGDESVFRRKLADAAYVGDKYPRLTTRIRILDERFPDPRVIFIFRDPMRVASSWEVRANNEKDRWDPSRDFKAAVEGMNDAFLAARKLGRQRPDRFLIVEYERIFAPDNVTTVAAIFDWLGLDFHPSVRDKWVGNQETFRIVQAKPLAPIDQTYVKKHIDWDSYAKLQRRSI